VAARYAVLALLLVTAWFALMYALTASMLAKLRNVICDPWASIYVVFAYAVVVVSSMVVLLAGLAILEIMEARSNVYNGGSTRSAVKEA